MERYKSLDDLMEEAGRRFDVSPAVAGKVYESVFSLMRNTVKELPDLGKTSSSDLEGLRTNFFVPRFCRFFIDLKKKRFKEIKNYKLQITKKGYDGFEED